MRNIIGDDYKGSWVSDRYSAQLKIACKHQLCLAHLIRECRYLIESEGSLFAKELKDLLEQSIHFRNSYGGEYDPNSKDIFRKVQIYEENLDKILEIRPKEKDILKLWQSLVCRREQLLLFLRDKEIPPTNNDSERALRNLVTKRKVSGCCRSEYGAKRQCIISTVIETAKKQCVDVLQALSPDFRFA